MGRSPNVLYPHKCYKGIVYTEGGNNKVLYCGIQDQYYTYTMFDAVALWAVKYILGEIKLPNKAAMVADWKKWVDRNKALKNCHEEIDFQTDYVMDLAKEANYGHDLDVTQIFYDWEADKDKDILTYRDISFTSKFTSTKSPIHHTTFMTALDDSLQCFMNTIIFREIHFHEKKFHEIDFTKKILFLCAFQSHIPLSYIS